MKEISDMKPISEIPESEHSRPDIKIKPIDDISAKKAEDIFSKLLEDQFEPGYYLNHSDGVKPNSFESGGKIENPERISLKDADRIFGEISDEIEDDLSDEETDISQEDESKESDFSEEESQEYNEDGTRELTEEEKQNIKDKLGWSDEKLKKCTIDKDGVIHYKTDRCDLEGKTSENGVPYERRRITINGVVIEGVFPKFDSVFDTELDADNYKTKAYAKECNAKLKEAIENDPELRSKFTGEQLKDIEEGRTPTGYVWHHNEEPGKMQLVKREDHDRAIGGAAHTGGNSLWGVDSIDNSQKGESF